MTVRVGDKSSEAGPVSDVCCPAGQAVTRSVCDYTRVKWRFPVPGNPQNDGVIVFPAASGVQVQPTAEGYRTAPIPDCREGASDD